MQSCLKMTLREFLAKAESEYGCRLRRNFVHLTDGDGKNFQLSRLERPDLNLSVTLPDIPLDNKLTGTILRNLCTRLNLPPADFELDLDDVYS